MAASIASIQSMFTAQGHDVVVIDSPLGDGYIVVCNSRESAYSVGRTVLNAFDADPESGSVTVGVSAPTDGKHAVVVTISR